MPAGFFTDKSGKVRPLSGKKKKKKGGGGTVVVAGVLALGMVGYGGGGALMGSGGGGGGAGGGASPAVDLRVRKAEGQKSARKGDSADAWRRMGVRELRREGRRQVECLTASHGRVREFLARVPCASLDRIIVAVGDDVGTSAVVSVAWVGFRRAADVRDFKSVIDVDGSGDVRPLGSALLGLADIAFTGRYYGSDVQGTSLTVAEAENATGAFDPEALDALAEVAAYLPRP
ncbi:hypothetical protein ACFFQW_24945 [Umezawaea endophytica]|uniref:Uncharacterized protein n=1 Tax=Umezawaea endophytica TaxID=1654476 RepID=A0A9X3AFZ1_9PSEU|nr:hypothetical protein [Umezawaea endophytica]MCS7479372.1 hypothetical protein [Umezawaea endophytica]